jgi:serine/threonine-protein kinase
MSRVDVFLTSHGLDPELGEALESFVQAQAGSWMGVHSGVSGLEDEALPADPAPPAERYQDLGPLGLGGMGEVRRVLDTHLDRVVALKRLRPELLQHPQLRARFVHEARATAKLDHPGIVSLHELGVDGDGRTYFTMDLIQGRTLREAFADPALSLRLKVDHLYRAIQALAYAHEQGVVHRDFKPSNVMIGAFGQVLVVDWGLVRQVGQQQSDQVSGTPNFMPPEQARGQDSGPAADVYAVGATLYTLLRGHPPWLGFEPEEVLERLRGNEVPHLEVDPAALCDLALQCMRAKAQDRPANAQAVARALQSWLGDAQAQAQARERLSQAQELQAQVGALWRSARDLGQQAQDRAAQTASHAPVQAHRQVWAIEDAAAQTRSQAELAELAYVQGIQSALAEAELPAAHFALAAYYRSQHVQALRVGDSSAAHRSMALLRRHDRGEHRDYLAGRGWLSLETSLAAVVRAFRYEEQDRRLVPVDQGVIGTTPLQRHALQAGSYLLEVQAPGCEVVRLPVEILAGESWQRDAPPKHPKALCALELPALGSLGSDCAWVAAGWFRSGDPAAKDGLPRQRVWVDDFVIAKTPVTNAQYLTFLNDLVSRGQPDQALSYAPRSMPHGEQGGQLQYGQDAAGRFELVPDAEGDIWSPEWPVVFVDRRGAQAYCVWLNARQGRPAELGWRLPWELEREKAVRGVDGRRYSWGNHPFAGWSANREGVAERPTPSDVGSHPEDCSPYGVLDGCGNVRDACLDPKDAQHPCIEEGWARPPMELDGAWGMLRGGSWASAMRLCLAGQRFSAPQDHRSALNGFRIARSLERWHAPEGRRRQGD